MTKDDLRTKMLSLKRPMPADTKYLIECELEDLVELVEAYTAEEVRKARIDGCLEGRLSVLRALHSNGFVIPDTSRDFYKCWYTNVAYRKARYAKTKPKEGDK